MQTRRDAGGTLAISQATFSSQLPFLGQSIMSSHDKKGTSTRPPAAARFGVALPHLHRFAGPACGRPDGPEEPTTIFEDVLRAAHRETERIDAAVRTLRPDSRSRIEAMLGVISYCYAKGVFDSEEIERRLWQDEAFLATFGEGIPSARKIRSFRWRHRENLLAIIEQALQESARRASSPAASSCDGVSAAGEDSVRLQAQQLLDMASIMDQLASD